MVQTALKDLMINFSTPRATGYTSLQANGTHPPRYTPLRLIAGALGSLPVVKGDKAIIDPLQAALAGKVDIHNVAPPREVELDEIGIHIVRNATNVQPAAQILFIHVPKISCTRGTADGDQG